MIVAYCTHTSHLLIIPQAQKLGMKYPKYMFLTYGSYESRWWANQSNDADDTCSPDDIAEVLQFSLAVLHFHIPSRDNLFYHSCYDATWSLAYALDKAMEGKDYLLWAIWLLSRLEYKLIHFHTTENRQWTKYLHNHSRNMSQLIKKHIEDSSFQGISVSMQH